MLKRILLGSTLALIMTGAVAANYQESDIAGVWETASGGYVQLYQNGRTWAGKIVGSKSGKARQDKNNPDESKRDRRLLGVNILSGLIYAGDGKYEGGEIYDPDNGKTYKANATLTGPDTLDARGYIGISLIGRSQTWHRIDPSTKNVKQDLLQKPVRALQ